MVVNAYYSAAHFHWRIIGNWWGICSCTFYLYTFLAFTVQKQDRYKTILVIVTGFLVIAWILFVKEYIQAAEVLAKLAVGIGLFSVFIPIAAKGIEWVWLKFAHVLGWINSKILLGAIFFLFLLPIALVSRLFTKDPLKLKGRELKSMFTDRNHLYTKEDLENIW